MVLDSCDVKKLSNLCKPVLYDDPRVLGLEIQSSDFKILLLCVYLPYECDHHYDDFMHYLAKLKNIIDDANTPYVYTPKGQRYTLPLDRGLVKGWGSKDSWLLIVCHD